MSDGPHRSLPMRRDLQWVSAGTPNAMVAIETNWRTYELAGNIVSINDGEKEQTSPRESEAWETEFKV
jgi:hypothetical protein